MKNLTKIFVLMLACILLCTNNAWAATSTYTFSNKAWASSVNSGGTACTWTGSSDGNQYSSSSSPKGVQILASLSGLTVTSSVSFTNVTSVVVTYSSSSKGVGSINVKIGSNSALGAQSIAKSQTDKTLTYTPGSAQSGKIVITCNCSTNSYGIQSIAVTTSSGSSTTYKVTYNGNGNTGGSVPTDATNYSSGATVTVKANTGSLVKTGYTFSGWNTKADGSGTTYTAGSGTFTISANTTLYAKWTSSMTYTVTFVDGVHGTDCSEYTMSNKASGTQIVFPSLADKTEATSGTCEQVHYHFAGWIEDGTTPNSTGSNVIAAGTTTINVSKNVTYKAVWAKKQQ